MYIYIYIYICIILFKNVSAEHSRCHISPQKYTSVQKFGVGIVFEKKSLMPTKAAFICPIIQRKQ